MIQGKRKKKELLSVASIFKVSQLKWVNIKSVGNFLLILRDTLLGNTRSEVGNICISSWFQLARWSTINWQQIGNVINPIIKFSKLRPKMRNKLYLRQKCHVNFRDRFEGLHANQIGFSKPPRKFTSSVLPFVGKIMVVLFSSLFTCWTDD